MTNQDKELSVLQENEVRTGWREKAEWRRRNARWLRYSQFIAVAVSRRLEQLGLNQKQFAERIGSSTQYVSKLLKGAENHTLETISKLEDALEMDLVRSALTYVRGYLESDGCLSKVAQPEPLTYGKKKI